MVKKTTNSFAKSKLKSFVWDKANIEKNRLKHRVKPEEAEEAFFDPKRKEFADSRHSVNETRLILVGKTKADRLLYIAYTIRNDRIRVISARDLNKREKDLYEKSIKNS